MNLKHRETQSESNSISVVIVTYYRGPYLIETIELLKPQRELLDNIYVIDQTPDYPASIQSQLEKWHMQGLIEWHRLGQPSITKAMNFGLQQADSDIVLFLDDDVIPSQQLISAHRDAYTIAPTQICGVVGQVLQPNEAVIESAQKKIGKGIYKDLEFNFNFVGEAYIENVIACNLSVNREKAINAGGCDENFVGVAYRFESEFAKRLARTSAQPLRFEPKASVHHLQAPSGGTRQYGNPLTSSSADHSVGDYYFAYKCAQGIERWRYFAGRALRAVRTRFHLKHPWWIPVKLLGEFRGLRLARQLAAQQPKLITRPRQGKSNEI